jgi:hypothetical protein
MSLVPSLLTIPAANHQIREMASGSPITTFTVLTFLAPGEVCFTYFCLAEERRGGSICGNGHEEF